MQTARKNGLFITAASARVLQLGFLAALSLALYGWAFVRPANLPEIYPRAEPDLYALYNAGSLVHLGIILAFVELGVLYLLAARLVAGQQERAVWLTVLASALAFGLVLLFVFPFDAADIFDYIIHGRMTGVYGVNPYLHRPNEFQSDPFYPYVAWTSDPSPYGPVWELLAGAAARMGGSNFLLTVGLYKLIPGLFHLGSVALAALILRKQMPQHALAGTLLLAWNPVVLYETWANGHNDMVMVFWLLAAVYAVIHRRFTLTILALVMATLVKFVPALIIPAAGLIALRELPHWPARLRFVLVTALAALLLTALIYAPFWEGPQVLTVLSRGSLFTSSIPASAYHVLRFEIGKADAALLVGRAALVVTGLFALWQAWRAGRNRAWDSLPQAGFHILTFYLMVTCLWFQQWYTLWPLALGLVLRSARARNLGLLFAFAALSKQLVMGPLLFWPRHRFPQPTLEILLTLGVLGLPWLFALYHLWMERQAHRRPVQTAPSGAAD